MVKKYSLMSAILSSPMKVTQCRAQVNISGEDSGFQRMCTHTHTVRGAGAVGGMMKTLFLARAQGQLRLLVQEAYLADPRKGIM